MSRMFLKEFVLEHPKVRGLFDPIAQLVRAPLL